MSRKSQQKNLAPVPSAGDRPTLPDLPAEVAARISRRAYELYSSRGREDGHALEDWLRAETELMHA